MLLKCEAEDVVCLCKEDLLHILICRDFTIAARRPRMHDAARSNWCVTCVDAITQVYTSGNLVTPTAGRNESASYLNCFDRIQTR